MVKVKINIDIWNKMVNKHTQYIADTISICEESNITKRKEEIILLCTENFFDKKCKFESNQSFVKIINKLDTEIGEISNWLVNIYRRFSSSTNKKWNGSIFVDETGIEVCPYCNINYTYSIRSNNHNHIRGQIDHIIPKHGKYQKDEELINTYSRLLSMNIYNMIPCCSQCNQKKSDTRFNVYPYQFDDNNSYRASYKIDINNTTLSIVNKREQIIKLKNDDFKIYLEKDTCQEHAAWEEIGTKLLLEERYSKHKEDLLNWARIRLLYSESKVLDMKKYGVEFPFDDESNDIKKPLNKQFRDIIQNQFDK